MACPPARVIVCTCIRERRRGEKTGSLLQPTPCSLPPWPSTQSGPCCQGLCSKPTCPVCMVVLATGEAQEAIRHLLATPLHHGFQVTEATERLCHSFSFHPSLRGLCRRGTRPRPMEHLLSKMLATPIQSLMERGSTGGCF